MTVLTPGILAFEKAARIACGKMSISPDSITQPGGPERWAHVAEQMLNLSVLMVSMQEAAVAQADISRLIRKGA